MNDRIIVACDEFVSAMASQHCLYSLIDAGAKSMKFLLNKRASVAKYLCALWLFYVLAGLLMLNWQAVTRFGMRLCSG
jgi:hypothetical protein